MRRLAFLLSALLTCSALAGNSVLLIRGSGGAPPSCTNDPCSGGVGGNCLYVETFEPNGSGTDACTGSTQSLNNNWTFQSGTPTWDCDEQTYALTGSESGEFQNSVSSDTVYSALGGATSGEYYVAFKFKPIYMAQTAATSVTFAILGHNLSNDLVSLAVDGTTDKLKVSGYSGCGGGDLTQSSAVTDGTDTWYVLQHWKTSSGASDGACETWATNAASPTAWPASVPTYGYQGVTNHNYTQVASQTPAAGHFRLKGNVNPSAMHYVVDSIQVATSPIDPCALD